jgi:hypothetical protein
LSEDSDVCVARNKTYVHRTSRCWLNVSLNALYVFVRKLPHKRRELVDEIIRFQFFCVAL